MNLDERKDLRLKYRAYLEEYTRTAESKGLKNEEEKFTDLDPELSLRFDLIDKRWGVYYDHNGFVNCIRIVQPYEPWALVLRDIRRNGHATKRDLIKQHQECKAVQEKRVQDKIKDAGHEAGMDLYHATRNRVMVNG